MQSSEGKGVGTLSPGDVVRLKSGSPAMVVIKFDPEKDVVVCRWNYRGRPFGSRYVPAALEYSAPDDFSASTPPPRNPGPYANYPASTRAEIRAARQLSPKSRASRQSENSRDAARFSKSARE